MSQSIDESWMFDLVAQRLTSGGDVPPHCFALAAQNRLGLAP